MTYVVVSKRFVLLFAGAGLLIIALFLLIREGAERTPGRVPEPVSSFLEEVRVINVQDEKVAWALDSRRAELLQNGKDTKLEEVLMQVPAEEVLIRAPGGSFDIESGSLTLTGEIKTEIKGYDMETGSIEIKPGGKISTGDRVILKGEGVEIHGRGLETADEKKVRLKSDVKARFN